MAQVEEMARRELVNDPTVNGYVGDRVYNGRVEQKETFPVIEFSRISSNPTRTLTGREGPYSTRVQYDFWEEPGENQNLNDLVLEVINLFKDWKGQLGWNPGIHVGATEIQGPRDIEAEEGHLFHKQIDVIFDHEEETV